MLASSEILSELEAIRAHSQLTADWATKLIEKIADPKPKKRKQSGLTEEEKAQIRERRMRTMFKK